jgi:hypothetical protein
VLALSPPPATAQSGVVDGCLSSSSCWAGAIIVCPAGDGHALRDQGATIFGTAMDTQGFPIAAITPQDWWLIGCNDGLALCNGPSSIDADGITDTNGQASIGGAIKAGGCDTGLTVILQGAVFLQSPGCTERECHPIAARSPDVNGDLIVDLVDFSIWAPSFLSAAAPACHDFSFDGVVDVVDFGIFGAHYLHSCQ